MWTSEFYETKYKNHQSPFNYQKEMVTKNAEKPLYVIWKLHGSNFHITLSAPTQNWIKIEHPTLNLIPL